MADYISSLTGVQVDAALLDMAEHNSEAYAVGERNGVPVSSGDETYNNNAKYYAQNASSSASTASSASSTATTKASQASTSATNAANSATSASNSATAAANSATAANNAADRAEAIVGGQFVSYGQTQGLSDAQKATARNNINATPNKNLLDNWYFVGGGSQQGGGQFPINQRGATTYSGNVYTIDRWHITMANTTITVNSDCITLANTSSSANAGWRQEIVPLPAGQYTLSATIKSGSCYICFYTDDDSLYHMKEITADSSWQTSSFTYTSSGTISAISIRKGYGVASVDIAAIKLEVGNKSTLTSDIPPVYSEELARCIYSTADPTDTYANAGYGTSNRNLLDNPFFTVRQRGNGSFTGQNVTGIDRWKTTNANSTVTGNDGYITLTAASGGNGFVRQYFPESLYGTYTYSAYIRGSGSGYIGINTNNESLTVLSSKTFNNPGNNWVLVTGTFTTSGDGVDVLSIRANAGTSINIKCLKLELGSVSTLANDAPPNYKNELDACQGYFQRIGKSRFVGTAVALNNGSLRLIVPIPTMAKTPTSATMLVPEVYDGSSWQAVTSYSVVDYDPSYMHFSLSTSITVTSGNTYLVRATHIDLSADL